MDEVANRQSWDVRVEEGRSRRTVVPLEDLASVHTSADRPDPVSILVEQDATRLQELVPIRHGRMRVTPFTFYRGAAAVMASDLSRTDSTDLRVQLCPADINAGRLRHPAVEEAIGETSR